MRLTDYTNNLLKQGKTRQVIEELTSILENQCITNHEISSLSAAPLDEVHYLLGNTYYKMGEWKDAIQHYKEACEHNSESPAREKLKMTYSILEFYNKDIYGQ